MEANSLVPKLRFKDEDGKNYPSWENSKLGEYCLFTQGIQIPHSKQEKYHKEGYVRYLYIRDFFSTSFKCYVKDEHPNKIIEEHQIMMVNTGNTSGSAYRGQRGVLSNNCFRISWDEKLFDADYMFLYLTSNFTQKKIKQFFNSGGQPHLGHKNAAILPFNYPCFNEQYKIASFINSLDKKINLLTKKKALLETYKKGVMQKIFSQEIRFKDEDGKDFPDWEFKRGNELFDSISNKKHNSDLPILAISQELGAVPREQINYKISVTNSSVSSYKIVEKGDFIISLRSFQGGIEYSNYKGICSPAYIILKSTKEINDYYFKVYFKTHKYIQQLTKKLADLINQS